MKKFQQSFVLPDSVLQDSRHEPLKPIIKPYKGLKRIPAELGDGGPACFVFIELNKCFQKQGYVAEGLLGNVIWGFEQCGYDARRVAQGLTSLRKLGYIYYSDESGGTITETDFNPKKPIWVRYQEKMTDLFIKEIQA